MDAPSPVRRVRHLRTSRGPRRHPLVIPAFVLALIPCCPPSGLLGAMLGILALRGIRLRPDLHVGRRMAITAILIGCVHAIVTAGLFQSFAQRQQEEQRRVARDVVRFIVTGEAPVRAVPGAASGVGSRAAESPFAESSAITDEELARLRDHLQEQYGTFEQFTPAIVTPGGSVLRPHLDMAGSFEFRERKVLGAARFDVTVQPMGLRSVLRLQWLRVGDEEAGRLGPVPGG